MILKCRCGKEYRIKDKKAQSGERFECKKCGKQIQVPMHFPTGDPGGSLTPTFQQFEAAAGGGDAQPIRRVPQALDEMFDIIGHVLGRELQALRELQHAQGMLLQ